MLMRRIGVALAGILSLLPATARAAETVIPSPVALPLTVDGTGLCIASAVSQNLLTDFGNLNAGNYNGSLNTFIEAHAKDRIESVVHTLLDLSNNNDTGAPVKPSYGDFIDAVLPTCKTGGCDFIVNDTTTPFGARLRGFFNVTSDLVGQKIHFGFYADDAVSLTFFGKSGAIYPVTVRPPQLGAPTWRVTNTVTFQAPGLYPLEILYVELLEHAALEMSYFIGNFTDFELPANQVPVTRLNDVGYTLFAPKSFAMTVSGQLPYPDPNVCKQCDRQFVNLPGNNGCDLGYYCNEAALCGPCDSAALCGPSCSPCGGSTPFCINTNGQLECGNCRSDLDCKVGYTCDLVKHECNQTHECEDDSQCDRGKSCVDFTCQWCDTPEHCAGDSCNCCPKGNNAKTMQCRPLAGDADGPPVCVECVTTADCAAGVCDVLSGLCVDKLAVHERSDCCGEDCTPCPSDAPFCLPNHLGEACATCRNDLDCKGGEFCLSGQCRACIDDRRCGVRCETCGEDTPFCLGSQIADTALCVRCTSNAQCPSGTCNTMTHDCEPACEASCGPTTPYCYGAACVECYADTQCPCGGTCTEAHTCSSSCKDNGDCMGNEHCRWDDEGTAKECTPGPMLDNSSCGSTLGSACAGSSIGSKGEDPVPPSGILALSVLAFLVRRRELKSKARQAGPGGRS